MGCPLACYISVVGCGLMSLAGPFDFGFRLIAYHGDTLFRPSVRFDGLLTPSQLSRQIDLKTARKSILLIPGKCWG